MVKLHIAPGFHTSRVKPRLEAIEDEVTDLDQLFVESQNDEKISGWLKLKLIFLLPLFLAFIEGYLLLLKGFQLVMVKIPIASKSFGDRSLAKKLCQKHGVEPNQVDKNRFDILNEKLKIWLGAELLFTIALIPYLAFYLVSDFHPAYQYALFIGVSFGIVGFSLAFLAGTVGERNHEIIHQIRNELNDDSEEILLITGGHHADGLEDIADREPNIDVNVIEKDGILDKIYT